MWAHARGRVPVAIAFAGAAICGAGLVGLAAIPAAQAAAGCLVRYEVNAWAGGFTAAIRVTAGDTAVNGWSLTWTYGADQRVTSAWNASVTQVGTTVTARNLAFNAQLPPGGSADFGVQATYGAANPAPAAFALNGVACNGGAPADPPPSSPAPSSPTPSAPGPSVPGPPAPPGSGCGSASFCDSFEDQTGTLPTGTWAVTYSDCQGTGTATIDSTVAHAGRRSVRINGTAGYCNHVFVSATLPGTAGAQRYGRFWVRHTTALPTQHVTFLAMRDGNDGGKDLRMGGQNGALQWNRASDDATLPEQSPAGVALSAPLATNRWTCVEFLVDGAAGRLQTWVDGLAVTGLQADGTPTHDIDGQWTRATWRPALSDLRLGWESYGEGADTLWFDDVAVGTARIGC